MSTVKSAGKVLRVIKALHGHSLTGVSIKELSEKLGELAKQELNGLYTIGTAMVQIAKAHDAEIQRAEARIAEIKQRTSIVL